MIAATRALPLALALAFTAGCSGTASPSGGAVAGATARAQSSAQPGSDQPAATALPVRVRARHEGGRQIEFTETNRANRIVYSLTADSQTAQRDPSGNSSSDFVNPHVRFVAVDGKRLYATSPAGTVTDRAKAVTVLMTGRVHAHTDDGMTLECDTMRYDDATQFVHARGNVVLTTATERLTGGALDADLRFSHVHLTPGDA